MKKFTGRYTTNTAKALKGSERILCQVSEDGTIYICNGFLLCTMNAPEYAATVQPLTCCEPGIFHRGRRGQHQNRRGRQAPRRTGPGSGRSRRPARRSVPGSQRDRRAESQAGRAARNQDGTARRAEARTQNRRRDHRGPLGRGGRPDRHHQGRNDRRAGGLARRRHKAPRKRDRGRRRQVERQEERLLFPRRLTQNPQGRRHPAAAGASPAAPTGAGAHG